LAAKKNMGSPSNPETSGSALNRPREALADSTIGDKIFRRTGDGRRLEFIQEISN